MGDRLPLEPVTLAELCRRHGIRKLSLFGSELKGTARPDSDIDLLVEFEENARPSLFDMAQIEIELSALLAGRRVDLRTAADLSRYFRDEVCARRRCSMFPDDVTGFGIWARLPNPRCASAKDARMPMSIPQTCCT